MRTARGAHALWNLSGPPLQRGKPQRLITESRRNRVLAKASAKAETDTALMAAQKAARDARYAARKARK